MKKSDAIYYINKQIKINLNSRNTVFANVGKHKDSWWLEPANNKLKSGFYFILNDVNNKKFLLFGIPKDAISKSEFRQREEKGVSQIIIPISNTEYVDRRGCNFNRFLINQIDY